MTALTEHAADVVCLGILVADTVVRPVDRLPAVGSLAEVEEISLHAGGCAINTASSLSALGTRVSVVGKVGGDVFGDLLLATLDRRGIDRRGVLRAAGTATSASVAVVDRTGERTFLHVPGANGTLRAEEIDADVLYDARALHVGGALVMPQLDGEPMAGLLREARGRGLFTSLDPVWDSHGKWARVHPCLPFLDLFCANLAEASGISGLSNPEEAARWFRAQGVGRVALKLGSDGCYVASESFVGHVEPFRVASVDGTGAGDAFVAGALYALLAGWSIEKAARLGNAAGALATTVVGAPDGTSTLSELLSLAEMERPA
jgi:sugar/nucleoside kinase (ribokinase family)